MALPHLALPAVQECAAVLDRLSPHLLRAAVGSAVVIALATIVALTMRRASAATRHGVWLAGAVGALLLPVLSAMLPGWHVLPHMRGVPTETSVVHVQVAHSTEQAISLPAQPAPALPQVQSPQSPAATSARNHEATANVNIESPATDPSPAPSTVLPADAAPLRQAPAPAPQQKLVGITHRPPFPWTPGLLLCWAFGTLLLIVRLLLGNMSLWLLRRRCIVITDGEMFDLLQRLCRELNLRRPVELLQSPARSMPMTWGLLHARLLLPQEADQWPTAQRRDVLLHELGHLKRGDCLSQLLSQIACALYWFNPLVWIADRRMQVERERACDDLVLNSGTDARAYARHLLESISVPSFPAFTLSGTAMAMARPSTLEERMRAILDVSVSRRGTSARYRALMVVLLLGAIVPGAILKAQVPQIPAGQEPPANSGAAGSGGTPAAPPTTRPAPQPEPSGFGGFAGGRSGRGFGGPTAPVTGEGPTCHFDATLYDVRMPIDRIGKLSAGAMDNVAQSAESFEKALAALGVPKPIYRANQSVRLSGDRINIGSNSPYVSNTSIRADGQNINTINYISTGATFLLAGKAASPDIIELDLSIQLSSQSESTVSIVGTADNLMPIIHTCSLLHKGPVQPGKSFVVITVDAGSLDKDGKAVAYIARVTVGDLQSR
ncbi:MAG TPA: M56 family metallopeptidase [Humisphaera sp.]|jgi:beta-lactamase regulating signal transducer with metallopeptidase domain|nr:M56 family metallopeptidase [Humisphaera sp.]